MKRILAFVFAMLPVAPLLAQPVEPQGGSMMAQGRLYTPGPFEAIAISGSAEVMLQHGPRDEVFVMGDDATQKQVELRLRDGTLYIDSPGWKFWNSTRLQLQISVRQLSKIMISGNGVVQSNDKLQFNKLAVHVSGAGMVRLKSLTAQEFTFNASGAGDADVAGRVQELNIGVSGRSEFRGENLMSRNARVQISGVGDVKVWATDELIVQVSGVGQLEYWGTPQVQRRGGSGMASIVPRGAKPAP